MRLEDMTAWVRRRLKDEEKVVFPEDGPIVSALNVGAWQVQKRVMLTAPDVFRRHYWRNLEIGKYRYQLPRGFIRPKQVFVAGVQALPGLECAIETGDVYGDELRYVITGGELVISYKPTTALEDGLHVLYVNALSLADPDDDLQDQGLVEPMHMAVVLWAVKLLLPEQAEDAKEVDAEIGSLLADIPTLYGNSGDTDFLVSGIGKELAE